MKLIRFGERGAEKPGVLTADGARKDCSGQFADWNRDFFNGGGLEALKKVDVASLPTVGEDLRWGSPVSRPGKVIAIGLNYSDHAAESGAKVPSEPVCFMKATSSVVGPYDNIEIPRGSQKTDWEVELAVVIGKDAHYLESVDESAEYIGGYCIAHDVSERAFQIEREGQWTKGKSCDTFCPLGPFVATKDEIENVQNLDLTLDVNGYRKQTGNTSKMVYNVFHLVYYMSQFMTLEAGDVISTGTPAGIGGGMKPPQFLKAGDVVELTVSGLGSMKQTCVQA